MKEKYNATFSGNNERHDVYGAILISRRPSLLEMQVAKSALERFGLVNKKDGMKFIYAAQPLTGAHGEASSLNNVNAIYRNGAMYFPPNYYRDQSTGTSYKWFQKDAKGPYRQEGSNPFENASVEGYILHELAHSVDEKRDPTAWADNHRNIDLGRQFGFREVNTAHRMPDGNVVNMRRTAVMGKNDDYFLRTDSGWAHYNKAGQHYENATFAQMAAQAKVPPGTIYWTEAFEASADVKTALYTGSGESVRQRSVAAYQAALLSDQEDIDFIYGKDPSGNSRRIRLADGRLALATEAHFNSLSQFARQVLQRKVFAPKSETK